MSEAIRSELLDRARPLRRARDTTTSVAAPTCAAAAASAAPTAAVDTDCLLNCASSEQDSATTVLCIVHADY